ncbi:unnamed protein product [Wuchereria bancrofti]|uniref:Uncharacterized protein n=1 Tax=Wuchereria bancrofti TaxID=6293 RepID=A0A3P7DJY8_WUCBA|nr:unnamed protein product [Wuchereria bancrofti]
MKNGNNNDYKRISESGSDDSGISAGNSANDSGISAGNSGSDSRKRAGIKSKLRSKLKSRKKPIGNSSDSKSNEQPGIESESDTFNSGITRGRRGRGSENGSDTDRDSSAAIGNDAGASDPGNESKPKRKYTKKNTVELDDLDSDSPKKVKPKTANKKIDSKTILAETVGIPFFAIGIALNENHWFLSEEEKDYLSESLDKFLSSIPKSRLNKVNKLLSKYLPTLNLAFAFGVVTYPRFKHSKLYETIAGKKSIKEES